MDDEELSSEIDWSLLDQPIYFPEPAEPEDGTGRNLHSMKPPGAVRDAATLVLVVCYYEITRCERLSRCASGAWSRAPVDQLQGI